MKIALLFLFETILLVSTEYSTSSQEQNNKETKGNVFCPIKLRPSGQCGDGEECLYQVTLPPLTIELPKQLKMLEKTMKELQNLKEVVNKLKSSCLECKQQADESLQKDSSEVPGHETPSTGGHGQKHDPNIHELQNKMYKMSNSLKNARNQIIILQGRMEEMSLSNIKHVEAMVDGKVKNLTGVVNKLNNKCSSQCAAETPEPSAIIAPRDCSDYFLLGEQKNGLYRVTPDPRNGTFEVYCDMESYGGGWTVLQHRHNGSVSFNRTWKEYKKGFGSVKGEFWLGNDNIHLLTKAKDMILRIELEDFEGIREYAKYEEFYVSNEYLQYRLSVSGYSGTAGDALHFNKRYNHDQKLFTTPDKDNDMYPSGNCGAYYSSGWWFDACMSANLNGKYYHKNYKGVRNGIFWGTWHSLPDEHPSSYRQAFKTVKMMIRPKNYAP
ncbi:fibroleukin-like [Acipenser oxyrinchus oxyrinchus]|uniref:Fibroleukin-like n=1 Tax=Acipenser oxyrinchus oxyrinchus TaxID=40147 RepID=A0AAD8G7G7_ACIOX|nr:fibroleukin-like [Acipenser oxyrinchus oxyrinchus]